MRQLRPLMAEHIQRWYVNAHEGSNQSERRRAAKNLREIGAQFAPDLRGRQKYALPDPLVAGIVYFKHLFRLRRALALLESLGLADWRASRDEKMVCVCRCCGISVDELRTFLRLDELESREALLQDLRSMAGHLSAEVDSEIRLHKAEHIALEFAAREIGKSQRRIADLLRLSWAPVPQK